MRWRAVFATLLALVLSYAIAIVVHEWGHGTTAWLLGDKSSPFDIRYGGWLLLHPDEAVNYRQLLASGHAHAAAAIGITGYLVNAVMAVVSLVVLGLNSRLTMWWSSWWYWLAVMNLMAVYGYTPAASFLDGGDIGWFNRGLGVNEWIPLTIGTIAVSYGIYRLLRYATPVMYARLDISRNSIKRLFLWTTLMVLFLLLNVHGFSPAFDSEFGLKTRIIGWVTIVVVPVLALICDPSRSWVHNSMSSTKVAPQS